MATDIFEKVKNLIADYTDVSPEEIQLEASFNELGMDSLDGLSLISDLEEEFDVTIPNEEALNIKTVGDAVNALKKVASV